MNRYSHQVRQFRNQPPLTNQVPNLNQFATNPHDERFGLLPFVGGLALGGLFFNGGGCYGRPCGGYPAYPAYPPMYYPQPNYPYQQNITFQQAPTPYQQAPSAYPYQPYTQNPQSTVVETNKFYMS